MLATYGAYRAMHTVKSLCSRRVRLVLAVRTDASCSDSELERKFGRVASVAINMDRAESEPVVLCEDEEHAQKLSELGYSVYVRF